MKTLCIIKPDAMEANVYHQILGLLTHVGLSIAKYKKLQLTSDQIDNLYQEHMARSFYGEIKDFMQSGEVIALVLEGDSVVVRLREIMGATNSKDAAEGTIRYMFGNKSDIMRNCVHGSDSSASAEREIAIIFPELEGVSNSGRQY